MTDRRISTVVLMAALFLGGGQAVAQEAVLVDGGTEAVESIVAKVAGDFGAETAEIGGKQVLAKSVEACAEKYGTAETAKVFETVGPQAVDVMEKAPPAEGAAVFRFMAKRGMDSLYVVGQPRRLAIFAKFGDEAGEAMLKQKGLAEAVIEKFGMPGAKAMEEVDGQNAVRLVKMTESGELAAGGQPAKLLGVVGQYGDRAANFIWRNKGALAVAAGVTAFLSDPKAFIDGAKSLTRHTVGAVIRRIDWTPVVWLAAALAAVWIGLARWRKRSAR